MMHLPIVFVYMCVCVLMHVADAKSTKDLMRKERNFAVATDGFTQKDQEDAVTNDGSSQNDREEPPSSSPSTSTNKLKQFFQVITKQFLCRDGRAPGVLQHLADKVQVPKN